MNHPSLSGISLQMETGVRMQAGGARRPRRAAVNSHRCVRRRRGEDTPPYQPACNLDRARCPQRAVGHSHRCLQRPAQPAASPYHWMTHFRGNLPSPGLPPSLRYGETSRPPSPRRAGRGQGEGCSSRFMFPMCVRISEIPATHADFAAPRRFTRRSGGPLTSVPPGPDPTGS